MKFAMLMLCFGTIIFINLEHSALSPTEKKTFYAPSKEITRFTLGYNETMADIYWLQLIQDVVVCGREETTNFGSSSNPMGSRTGLNRTPACRRGWGSQMLDLITELSPRFHAAASLGPLFLSVITDDIEGATIIFEKSVKNFPDNWLIHYQAGYHYMVELENKKRAAELYEVAAKNPAAPPWLTLLIAKLRTEEGEAEVAEQMLLKFRETVRDDPELLERTERKLHDLKQKK